jgi:hypothetical protein
MTEEELKPAEWYYEDDGWGIVGVSFGCPHCDHNNRFASGEHEPQECEKCHKESMPTSKADCW